MAGFVEGATPGTEMTGISFRDQLWLNSFPLERALVFDYFALSPFYDRTCNNEQLRMRSIHPLDTSQLSKMTGVEYMLHEVQEPNLFIFRKQKRDGPEKAIPISAYYILDGSIYQAPNLHNVIGSRVVRALYHISKAFSEATTKLEKIGYDSEAEATKSESKRGADESKKGTDVFDVKQVMRIDQILTAIQRKLPPAPPPPPLMSVGALETVASGTSIMNDGVPALPVQQAGVIESSAVDKHVSKPSVAEQPSAKRVKTERI